MRCSDDEKHAGSCGHRARDAQRRRPGEFADRCGADDRLRPPGRRCQPPRDDDAEDADEERRNYVVVKLVGATLDEAGQGGECEPDQKEWVLRIALGVEPRQTAKGGGRRGGGRARFGQRNGGHTATSDSLVVRPRRSR